MRLAIPLWLAGLVCRWKIPERKFQARKFWERRFRGRLMDELTREFLIESQEGLDRMERCLTDLEERPQDKELLGEIFRAVHTIKGTT